MPLDLDPIRALLIESDAEAVELTPRDAEFDYEWPGSYSQLGHGAVLVRGPEGAVPPLAFFLANAPAYVAALLDEVESLREERSLSVAMCPSCGEVTKCDEDRCCVSCGRDLIVLADRHSADLVSDLTGENEGLHAELKTAQSDLACFKEDLRHVQVTLDQLRYRIERRDIY